MLSTVLCIVIGIGCLIGSLVSYSYSLKSRTVSAIERIAAALEKGGKP